MAFSWLLELEPLPGIIVYASRIPPRRPRTSNVRAPVEHGSDRRENLAKRVSEDLQLSIFSRRKFFFEKFFDFFSDFFSVFRNFR